MVFFSLGQPCNHDVQDTEVALPGKISFIQLFRHTTPSTPTQASRPYPLHPYIYSTRLSHEFMNSPATTRVLRAFARAQRTIPRLLPRVSTPLRPSAAPSQIACLRSQFHTAPPRLKKNKTNEYEGGTDFSELDVLGNTPTPSTSIDVCMSDGFSLNSGLKILDGNAALLIGGEAFEWRPWEAKGTMNLINAKGQFEIPPEAFGVLELVWPRPGSSPF